MPVVFMLMHGASLTVGFLIGVTVVRFGKAWEPCWDARGLKALQEMRWRDVQWL
jgi:hypothetical protein